MQRLQILNVLWTINIGLILGIGQLAVAQETTRLTGGNILSDEGISLQERYEREVEYFRLDEERRFTESTRSSSLTIDKYLSIEPDSDDDGMPDSWEITHSLNPNDPRDAWRDLDGDEVINLFEYQLSSDPNNSLTPTVLTVSLGQDVGAVIKAATSGQVIRVAGGYYTVNYITFIPKTIMIQGGWNKEFTSRDLSSQPTVFDGQFQKEVLYFAFSNDTNSVILDGLTLVNGKESFGALYMSAGGTSAINWSIINCLITNSESTFDFGGAFNIIHRDSSVSEVFVIKSIIANNLSSGIKNQTTKTAFGRWRIINSDITYNQSIDEREGLGIDGFTLDNALLTIKLKNSILWGNQKTDLQLGGFGGPITIDASFSDIGSIDMTADVTYNPASGLIDTDPFFLDPENGDFHLLAESQLIDAGIDIGLPFFGVAPDIGALEYLEDCTIEASAIVGPSGGIIEVTNSSCPLFGARVEIPEGALETQHRITIQSLSKSEIEQNIGELSVEMRFFGGININAEGATLKKPINISLPNSFGATSSDQLLVGQVMELNNDTTSFMVYKGLAQIGSISITAINFGLIGVLSPKNQLGIIGGTFIEQSGEPIQNGVIATSFSQPFVALTDEVGYFEIPAGPAGSYAAVMGVSPSAFVPDLPSLTGGVGIVGAQLLSTLPTPPSSIIELLKSKLIENIIPKELRPSEIPPGCVWDPPPPLIFTSREVPKPPFKLFPGQTIQTFMLSPTALYGGPVQPLGVQVGLGIFQRFWDGSLSFPTGVRFETDDSDIATVDLATGLLTAHESGMTMLRGEVSIITFMNCGFTALTCPYPGLRPDPVEVIVKDCTGGPFTGVWDVRSTPPVVLNCELQRCTRDGVGCDCVEGSFPGQIDLIFRVTVCQNESLLYGVHHEDFPVPGGGIFPVKFEFVGEVFSSGEPGIIDDRVEFKFTAEGSDFVAECWNIFRRLISGSGTVSGPQTVTGNWQLQDSTLATRCPDPCDYGRIACTSGGALTATIGELTSVMDSENEVPTSFELGQSYPNPFNSSTTIIYSLPRSTHVTLKVYNMKGQEIETIMNEKQEAGVHKIKWKPSNLSSGVYVYRLKAGEFTETKKLILLR